MNSMIKRLMRNRLRIRVKVWSKPKRLMIVGEKPILIHGIGMIMVPDIAWVER